MANELVILPTRQDKHGSDPCYKKVTQIIPEDSAYIERMYEKDPRYNRCRPMTH